MRQSKVTASLPRGWRCTAGFEFSKEEKTMKITWFGQRYHWRHSIRSDLSGTTLSSGDTDNPRGTFHPARALLE